MSAEPAAAKSEIPPKDLNNLSYLQNESNLQKNQYFESHRSVSAK